ncbi:MAG: hypothetical protein KBA66_25150, partial [Leptospiraceae bacterium]|nr:hypothetical protein [Leptospiraceae bacterium]
MKDAIEQLQAIVLESVIEIESKKVTLETLPIYAKEVYQKWTNKLESISSLTEQGLSSIIRNELSKEKINFDFRDRIKNLLNETIIKSEIEKITKKIKEQKKYFEDKDKRIISPKFETVKHKLPYSAETYEVIQQVINETSKKFVEQSKIDDDALIKEIKNCTEQKIKQLELYSRVTLFTNEILNEPNNGKYTQIKFPDFAIEAIQESIYKLVKKKLPIKDDRIKKEIRTQLKIKKPPISIPIQIKTNKLSPGFMELVIAEEISKISNPKLRSKIENIYLAAGEMPKDQKKLIELFDKAREDNSFSDILNLLAEPSVLKFWSYRVMFKKNKTSFKNKNFIIHGVILNDYINENLIACHIPDTFLRKKLVAHFDFNSEWITAFIVKKKYVKRSSEISGKSKNDFSSPITYKLISKFQRKLKRTILNKELKSLVKTGKSEIELSEEDYNFFVNKVGKTFSFREHKDKTKETDKSYQNIIKEKIRDIQSKLLSEKIFVTEEDIEDIFFYTKIKISKVASYE